MALLQGLAERCRSEYIKIRSLFTDIKTDKTVTYTPHPKWECRDENGNYTAASAWMKMAIFFQKHGFAIFPCIYSKFRQRLQDRYSIYKVMPNQFTYAGDIDMYMAATQDAADEIRYQFNSEHTALVAKIYQYRQWHLTSVQAGQEQYDYKKVWTSALVSEDSAISPLMRMCVIFSEELYEPFYESMYLNAVIQYVDNRKAYDTYWDKILPVPIKESYGLLADYLNKKRE